MAKIEPITIPVTFTPRVDEPKHEDGPLVAYLVKRLGYGDDAPRHARSLARLVADYHRERGFLIVSEQGFDDVLKEKRRLADEVEAGREIIATLRKELADANKRTESLVASVSAYDKGIDHYKRELEILTEQRDDDNMNLIRHRDEIRALKASLDTATKERRRYKKLIVDAYIAANGARHD